MTSVTRKTATKDNPAVMAREMIEVAATTLPQGPAYDYLWYGRDNVFALMSSGQVMARGCHELSTAAVRLWRDQIRHSMEIGKAFVGARSCMDIADISASLLKSGITNMTTESIRFVELFARVLEQASVPVRGRVAATGGTALLS